MKVEGGTNGRYQIRLIPPNCHHEQMIVEIVGALDYLDAITNEIFTNLETRLRNQRTQMTNISARIDQASEKINQLKQSRKGIRVVSSSKFPQPNLNQNLDPGYSNYGVLKGIPVIKLKPLPTQQEFLSNNYEVIARIKTLRSVYEPAVQNIEELLQFYHVRDKHEHILDGFKTCDNNGIPQAIYDLGQPPPCLKDVDSFFVFNSMENAYQKPEKIGSGSTDDRSSRRGQVDDLLVALNDGPSDAGQNVVSKSENADDFYYYPSSVQIPEIDVPDFLPDLPGIMDTFGDLNNSFTSSDSSLLMPFQRPSSVSTTEPTFNTTVNAPRTSSANANATPMSPPEEPTSTSGTSLSPIQNVMQATVPVIAPAVKVATPSAASSVPPPPPPPPPPPMPVEGSAPAAPGKPKASAPVIPAAGNVDVRSNLMEAIRAAGGSGSGKLRSAKDRREEAKRKKQDEKGNEIGSSVGASGGVDMMADLKNKLAMRRKGISGAPAVRQPNLGDIMQTMSSKIPNLNDDDEFTKSGGGSDDDDGWD